MGQYQRFGHEVAGLRWPRSAAAAILGQGLQSRPVEAVATHPVMAGLIGPVPANRAAHHTPSNVAVRRLVKTFSSRRAAIQPTRNRASEVAYNWCNSAPHAAAATAS